MQRMVEKMGGLIVCNSVVGWIEKIRYEVVDSFVASLFPNLSFFMKIMKAY